MPKCLAAPEMIYLEKILSGSEKIPLRLQNKFNIKFPRLFSSLAWPTESNII